MTGDLWGDDPVNRPTPVKFDWANKVVLPALGIFLLWAAWWYGYIPLDVIKDFILHD
jgi:hypothetical protein